MSPRLTTSEVRALYITLSGVAVGVLVPEEQRAYLLGAELILGRERSPPLVTLHHNGELALAYMRLVDEISRSGYTVHICHDTQTGKQRRCYDILPGLWKDA